MNLCWKDRENKQKVEGPEIPNTKKKCSKHTKLNIKAQVIKSAFTQRNQMPAQAKALCWSTIAFYRVNFKRGKAR